MNLLFVTPECAPLTKTGGLGDVSAALPAALRERGVNVRVLIPGYREVQAGARALVPAARLQASAALPESRLLEGTLPNGVPVLVLDCPPLYERAGGPYQSSSGEDWHDNALRFGMLCRAAALLGSEASPLGWRPDVIHCNDWPAALTAAFLRFEPGARAGCVTTIHNLAFQGNFPPVFIGALGLPASSFSIEGLEFYGQLSFLKAGIVYADAVTTVSPTYAAEIQTEAHGCGLHGLLQARRSVLTGILNGIDTVVWDPARDPYIAQRYDAATLAGKAANKSALRRRLGLKGDATLPLAGVVSRFTDQKGIDLIAEAVEGFARLPMQLAVLGTGERKLESALRSLAERYPETVALRIGFDESLAHAIEAGADLFLMPSRYEPCGLNQMYSQRYGTPPVARATGGLANSIVDGETGFLFERADSGALLDAVRRALEAYRDAGRWERMQRAGMARDFSWGRAAAQYAELYARLTKSV